MMKKERLLLILCGLFCGAAVAQPRLPTPPNMIVILADDLGYGDLGCTGSRQIKTPSIDRLAKEGVFCSRAYVTAPMCSPSRMGLLTGRFPKRYGITTNPEGLSSGVPLRAAADGKIDSGVFGPLRVPERGIRQVASWPHEGIYAAGARFYALVGVPGRFPALFSREERG